jgi:hypothetical protein
MRELLYLSTAKLASFVPDSNRRRPTINEIEVSLWGLRIKVTGAAGGVSEEMLKHLGRVEKDLSRHAHDLVRTPTPPPGAWFHFRAPVVAELPAQWLGEADVALFACLPDARGPVAKQPIVLLCGSERHVLGRSPAPGDDRRSHGSVPDPQWFSVPSVPDDVLEVSWRELNRRRLESSRPVDEPLDQRVGSVLGQADARSAATWEPGLWVTYLLHRAVSLGTAATHRGVMRGYARVLLSGEVNPSGDGERVPIILGSPLVVEYSR